MNDVDYSAMNAAINQIAIDGFEDRFEIWHLSRELDRHIIDNDPLNKMMGRTMAGMEKAEHEAKQKKEKEKRAKRAEEGTQING